MKYSFRFRILSGLLLALLLGSQAAAQSTKLEGDGFELLVAPDATVVSRQDNGWETKMVLEQNGQRVRVSWRQDQAVILFPNSSVRVTAADGREGKRITTFDNGTKYEVIKSGREISWKLPGQDVFFRTRGGRVSQVVGNSDYLKLYPDTLGKRITVESSAGRTDALLNNKGQLETFDGPDVTDHVYLVRGFAYQKGPVTLRFPLPEDLFIDGLPKDRYLTVHQDIKPLPKVEKAAVETPEKRPLEAKPATWDSPELRATEGKPDEDPLHSKREKIVKHPQDPLRAKTSPDSEGILQVKTIDTSTEGDK